MYLLKPIVNVWHHLRSRGSILACFFYAGTKGDHATFPGSFYVFKNTSIKKFSFYFRSDSFVCVLLEIHLTVRSYQSQRFSAKVWNFFNGWRSYLLDEWYFLSASVFKYTFLLPPIHTYIDFFLAANECWLDQNRALAPESSVFHNKPNSVLQRENEIDLKWHFYPSDVSYNLSKSVNSLNKWKLKLIDL